MFFFSWKLNVCLYEIEKKRFSEVSTFFQYMLYQLALKFIKKAFCFDKPCVEKSSGVYTSYSKIYFSFTK